MEYISFLAQAAGETAAAETFNIPIDHIWQQVIGLTWLQAVLAVSFGSVYLLYGWRIFKILVVICFGLIGLFVGMKLGAQFDSELAGAIVGLAVLALVSIPLMRWAVSILGAVAGGILAAGIWYAFELPEQYIIAGAITGVVAGGMISFIVFKVAVMLFTSLGGGILIVTGLFSLFYQYENMQEPATDKLRQIIYTQNWFLPVALMIPTFIGVVVQNNFIKRSKNWNI
jgi:hypothetical protein